MIEKSAIEMDNNNFFDKDLIGLDSFPSIIHFDKDKTELVLGNEFEIKTEGDRTFVVRKLIFPKTYEECCDVLNCNYDVTFYYSSNSQRRSNDYDGSLEDKLIKLRELIICRDAYLHLAKQKIEFNFKTHAKYQIKNIGGNLQYCENGELSALLSFGTPEVRGTFFNNFRPRIEYCKEFI